MCFGNMVNTRYHCRLSMLQLYTDYRTVTHAKCTDKQLKLIRLNLYNFDIFGRQSASIRELEKYRNLMIVYNNFVFFIFFLYICCCRLFYVHLALIIFQPEHGF